MVQHTKALTSNIFRIRRRRRRRRRGRGWERGRGSGRGLGEGGVCKGEGKGRGRVEVGEENRKGGGKGDMCRYLHYHHNYAYFPQHLLARAGDLEGLCLDVSRQHPSSELREQLITKRQACISRRIAMIQVSCMVKVIKRGSLPKCNLSSSYAYLPAGSKGHRQPDANGFGPGPVSQLDYNCNPSVDSLPLGPFSKSSLVYPSFSFPGGFRSGPGVLWM